MNNSALPRLVAQSLRDRLRVMPAVGVTGARQTGQSTLAQTFAPDRRRFLSLDDLEALDAVRRDPRDARGRRSTDDAGRGAQREPSPLHAVLYCTS